MASIPLAAHLCLFQRFTGVAVRVIEDRRGLRLALLIDGQKVVAIARKAVAGGPRDLLLVLVRSFGERGVKELHHRNIEPVEPEHRLGSFVGMVMPGHRRRNDKIAGLHRGALAIDSGIGALALKDKTQRRLAVPVRWRDVARDHHLYSGKQRGGDLRLAAQPGIFQHQHPPLGFLGGDQLARFGHVVADCIEFPQMRPAGALRLRRDQLAHHVPQCRKIFAVDLAVERLAFRRLLYGFHGEPPVVLVRID